MTKISIIGNIQGIKEELPKLNFLNTTEGELSLLLAKQRLWLYEQTRPEQKTIWRKGMTAIDNTLFQKNGFGVHGGTTYFNLPNELKFVQLAIKNANSKTMPANRSYVVLDNRTSLAKGLDIEKVGYLTVDEFEQYKPECIYFYDFQDEYGEWVRDKRIREDCLSDFRLMVGFNDKMPKTAHHSLYQFVTDENDRDKWTATAQIKTERHKSFIGQVKRVTGLSFQNLALWYKNAVMHRNSLNGLGDLTPEQNILQLKNNTNWDTLQEWDNNHDSIRLDPFTIIIIIVVAAKAIGGLIQICKDKEPSAFDGLTDIALSPNFAASGKDHKKDKDEDEEEDEPQDDPKDPPITPPKTGVIDWIKANQAPSALLGAGASYILYNYFFKSDE